MGDAESKNADEFSGKSITALQPVGRDAARTSIRCGRRSLGTIANADVQRLSLSVGQVLTIELIEELAHLSTVEKARDAAMRLVSARPYSTSRLRQRLLKRGFDGPVIDAVIRRLENAGVLDDAAYGRALIRQTRDRSPAGEALLRARLVDHGLDRLLIDELIDEALADSGDPLDDPEVRRLVERKIASMRHLEPAAVARRLFGLLGRRGFEAEDARRIVDRHVRLDD